MRGLIPDFFAGDACHPQHREVAVDTPTARPAQLPLRTDGEAVIHTAALWRILVRGAIIGIFLLLLIPFLESARAILMPVLAAVVVGTMLAPLTSILDRHGIPPIIYATLVVIVLLAALQVAVLALSSPIVSAVGQADQINARLMEIVQALERPLGFLRRLQSAISPNAAPQAVQFDAAGIMQAALAFFTPAIGEVVLFFASLFFFLMGRRDIRRGIVLLFDHAGARLLTI